MKKTLILVVDRDDDFGAKGQVETPVIGIEGCIAAATALGSADPEDSDTNALYAAINIYRDMEKSGKNPEIALVCGDQIVGHRSDEAFLAELEVVLNEVKPDGAILCGDGAEDEYVYPIVSSRVPIDSVRKVYVKQAPGVEGTFYIISKGLGDPQKRRRFLAPLSWAAVLICSVYLLANFLRYSDPKDWFLASTTAVIIFILGLLLMIYSYNLPERTRDWVDKWASRARHGSLTVIFLIAAAVFVIFGIFVGYYALTDVHTTNVFQEGVWFLSNALWLVLFGLMFYMVGDLLDRYLNEKRVKYTFITNCIDIVAIGLLITAALDFIITSLGFYHIEHPVYLIEFFGGIALALAATLLQHVLRRASEQTS